MQTFGIRLCPHCCVAWGLYCPSRQQAQGRPGGVLRAFEIKGVSGVLAPRRPSPSPPVRPSRLVTGILPWALSESLEDPHGPQDARQVPGDRATGLGRWAPTGPGKAGSQLSPCRMPPSESVEPPRDPGHWEAPRPRVGQAGKPPHAARLLDFPEQPGVWLPRVISTPWILERNSEVSRLHVLRAAGGGRPSRGWQLWDPAVLPGRSPVLGQHPTHGQAREALREGL